MSELEEENPKFACLITGYNIEKNNVNQVPYYALKAYERNGGPINHLVGREQAKGVLKDYSLLGRRCFYHSLKFINRMKLEILDIIPVFQEPITDEIAYQIFNEPILGKNYKQPSAFKQEISSYPLTDLVFAQAQKALSMKFNTTLVYRWQDRIAQNIDKMIKKFFHGAADSKIIKKIEDLNPYIIRFLKCVQQLEVSHLHEKFKHELTDYLHFLLRFSNLDEKFRKTPIYRSKNLDKILIDTSKVPLLKIDMQTRKVKFE